MDETHAAVARRYHEEAGVADRITIHLGPALETIEKLEGDFDLIFIDADKLNYPAYYEALVPRLSPQGIMALDNTLRVRPRGRAAGNARDRDVRRAERQDAADPRVVAVQLTVRDGVTLVRRA